MAPAIEHRRYHPDRENVPLSVAVSEAIAAHEHTSMGVDDLDLSEHVDPEAIDLLFRNADDTAVIVQFHLTDVIVSIWSDGEIDIRVTDELGDRRRQ